MARKVAATKTRAKRKAAAPEARATPENPRFNLSDPEAWDMLAGGSRTDSGLPMNKSRALTYAPVWQAVSLISGDIAKLPLELYKTIQIAGRRAREEVMTHRAYRLCKYKANRETSAFIFWRRVMVHQLLWNRAFAYIDRDSLGNPLEIFNLCPDRTAPERLRGKEIFDQTGNVRLADQLDGQLVYTTEVDGKLQTLFPSQVLDFQGINFEAIESCDLVDKARNSWALGLAQEKFASRFFANGSRVSGILEIPAAMGKVARDKLEEGFLKAHTGQDNWFKTVVLRDGAKFHQTSVAPEQGQMTESRDSQVRDVARWFNLSPSKLGLSDSVSYNSKTEDNQNYLDSTLSPHLMTITAECWMKLLSESEQVDHFFEHDTDQILRLDPLKRFQMYEIGRRIGAYSPNDILVKENEAPRPGGDVYQDVLQGAGPKEGPKGDGKEEEQKQRLARKLDRVLWDIGRRALAKSDNKSAYLKWVEEGFPTVRDSASAALEGNLEAAEAFLGPILADFQRISPHLSQEMLRQSVAEVVKKHEDRSVLTWLNEHFSRN